MTVKFKDIQDAFDFVSFGQMYEHQAFLNKETGKIYWHSEFGDNDEELPEDIDDEKFIAIPHKNELGLGKRLVLKFAYTHLPDDADEVESIFSRKGAYSAFKNLLDRKDVIDKWYEFESQAQEIALRAWCEGNGITLHD
jgi:hypothetical protein